MRSGTKRALTAHILSVMLEASQNNPHTHTSHLATTAATSAPFSRTRTHCHNTITHVDHSLTLSHCTLSISNTVQSPFTFILTVLSAGWSTERFLGKGIGLGVG